MMPAGGRPSVLPALHPAPATDRGERPRRGVPPLWNWAASVGVHLALLLTATCSLDLEHDPYEASSGLRDVVPVVRLEVEDRGTQPRGAGLDGTGTAASDATAAT